MKTFLLQNDFKKNKYLTMFLNVQCKLLPRCAFCKETNRTYLMKRYSKIKSLIVPIYIQR